MALGCDTLFELVHGLRKLNREVNFVLIGQNQN
jgi:hypothetical protein